MTSYNALVQRFCMESWAIEGLKPPDKGLMRLHEEYIMKDTMTGSDIIEACKLFTNGYGRIRSQMGMDVQVGSYVPMAGGTNVLVEFDSLMADANSIEIPPSSLVFETHIRFEKLHPFIDGNGRTGRLLWAWMMARTNDDDDWLERGFLHTFYYQTLRSRQ